MNMLAWNVDTQYDFMRQGGKLYVPKAETIENKLMQLTNYFRKKGISIVNTGDWHTKDSKEISLTPDFISTFPEHCIMNTPGAEYIPATKPNNPYIISWQDDDFDLDKILNSKEIVLYKDAFDIFSGNKHTERILDILSPKRAIVYGVATDYCVNYAVTGLMKRGIQVYVIEDAIKDLGKGEETLWKWRNMGAEIIHSRYLVGKNDR